MSDYTVRNEPDFAPVYDEDDMVPIRRGDLRAVLDVATMSMDFGSGFLDNEQVEALRKMAAVLHIDPVEVTPFNFVCQYRGEHDWRPGQGRWMLTASPRGNIIATSAMRVGTR